MTLVLKQLVNLCQNDSQMRSYDFSKPPALSGVDSPNVRGTNCHQKRAIVIITLSSHVLSPS